MLKATTDFSMLPPWCTMLMKGYIRAWSREENNCMTYANIHVQVYDSVDVIKVQ